MKLVPRKRQSSLAICEIGFSKVCPISSMRSVDRTGAPVMKGESKTRKTVSLAIFFPISVKLCTIYREQNTTSLTQETMV